MTENEVVKAEESVCNEVMDALSKQVGRIETQIEELQSMLKPVWLDKKPTAENENSDRRERAELFDSIEKETIRLENVSIQIDNLLNEIQL